MHRLTKNILPLILLASWFGCGTTNSVAIPGTDDERVFVDATVLTDAKVSDLRIMRVRGKNSDCVSGYLDLILLHGEINDDATFMVKSLLDAIIKEDGRCKTKSDGKYWSTIIYLASHGGYLKDGFELGRLFRKYQVQSTITHNQTCASSCAAAFLGGAMFPPRPFKVPSGLTYS